MDSTNTNKSNHAISFEIVFDSIFVIFANNPQIIRRVAGTTYSNLAASDFYTLSSGGHSITTNNLGGATVANNDITTMCSMDFYGLFLGVKGSSKVIRLELDIANDDADPATVTTSSNVI